MTYDTNQWAILVLVLVLGWVLGLASRSGGAKWKRELAEERDRRKAAEARLESAQARVATLETAHARVTTVEEEAPVVRAKRAATKPIDPPAADPDYSPNG